MEIRTRFAPSPTGYLHIGGARTALFNWLYARHTGGKFILRIEDTDAQRSTDEATQQILDAMTWLGLDWDEGPFYQTQRIDIYRELIDKLVVEGKAYWCECSVEDLEAKREVAQAEKRKFVYDGTCRDKHLGPGPGRVVRFKSPREGVTSFDDLIRGTMSVNNEELDDLIILRSDGMPTYNFSVVVDDATMNINHIIRGDDHVNNTYRQIPIFEALGYELPKFAHVPMILGPDKTKLSKRHGATSASAYREMGFLPEALVNYLVRLSWSHGDQEIFSLEELISLFDVYDVGKSAAVFNPDKLTWLNHHYIKECDPARLAELMEPFLIEKGYDVSDKAYNQRVVVDCRERTKTVVELADFAEFYYCEPEIPEELRAKFIKPEQAPLFKDLIASLEAADFSDHASLEACLHGVMERFDLGFGKLAQPMRVALTGRTVSPGMYEILMTLGSERVLPRLKKILDMMEVN